MKAPPLSHSHLTQVVKHTLDYLGTSSPTSHQRKYPAYHGRLSPTRQGLPLRSKGHLQEKLRILGLIRGQHTGLERQQ